MDCLLFAQKGSSNFLKSVISYNDDGDLINKIRKLNMTENLAIIFQKKSYNFVKKFDWKKVSKEYLKIIKN